MCRYGYSSYGACGHSVIECREVCGVTLWRAGVTGDLILCVPDLLRRSTQVSGSELDESLQLTEFVGASGSCNACIKEFQIQNNVRQRDDNMSYFAGFYGHFPPDAVLYLQVEQLLTTFPHLLAIDQQLVDAEMDLGPVVLFPETIAKLTWADLQQQKPYKISGFWTTDEGMKPVHELLQSLQCTSGTSPQDRHMFVHVLTHNLNAKDFYEDVFRTRGMPYPMFNRLCAQIVNKAKMFRQDGQKTTAPVNHQPTTSVQPLRPQPLNNRFQGGSPRIAAETCVRPGCEDSAISLSPESLPHSLMQHTQTLDFAPRSLDDLCKSAVEPRLPHQDKSSQATQISQGTKRTLSSMQEEVAQIMCSRSIPQQDETTGSPAQRPRYSEPISLSSLNPDGSYIQASPAAPSHQLPARTVGAFGATNNGSLQIATLAQSVSAPQQLAVQHQVGQFDIAACRAMQAQARAAQAVPIQPLPTAVVQAQGPIVQATQAQAAQAQAAQAQQTQPQVVNASRVQMLQAHYRRSQTPSEIGANQARASHFETGFNQIVEFHGLKSEAAQAGLVEPLNENQEPQMDGSPANLPSITQSPSQLSPTTQSFIDPSLLDHSAAMQSPSVQTPVHGPPQDLLAPSHTATQSPTSQEPAQASMEDISGKGKGVLPHVLIKATFFLNDQVKNQAISHLTRAWAVYRRSSEGSAVKEQAALWIVNFSLNFRQQWTLSMQSGGTLRQTTLAQLMQPRSCVRSNKTNSSVSALGAAQSQLRQSHNVVGNQTARQINISVPKYGSAPSAHSG